MCVCAGGFKEEEYKKDVGFVEVVEQNCFIRTTNKIVDKDVKLTWRDLWEVDVAERGEY